MSLLIAIRLAAGGAAPAEVRGRLLHLWLAAAAVGGLFYGVAQALGPAAELGPWEELQNVGARFVRLSAGRQAACVILGLAALGIFGHLVWALGRAMRAHELDGE